MPNGRFVWTNPAPHAAPSMVSTGECATVKIGRQWYFYGCGQHGWRAYGTPCPACAEAAA